MKALDSIAARLEELARKWPDGVPVDLIAVEVRRVKALAEMVANGLAD